MLFLENLQITNMFHSHSLAKSISNVGWNQHIKYTAHEAETANRIVVWLEKPLFDSMDKFPRRGLAMSQNQDVGINVWGLGAQSLSVVLEVPALGRGEAFCLTSYDRYGTIGGLQSMRGGAVAARRAQRREEH